MSFDKQNFSRTVAEQQAGIAPQMWPIKIDPGGLSLNSPFEVEINPCDCIWLPITYDKSYGVNPLQNIVPGTLGLVNSAIAGQNVSEIYDANAVTFTVIPQIFGLRFNSPNNPWLLWGLGSLALIERYGAGAKTTRVGSSTLMRSITGPISRLWCQFYSWAQVGGENLGSQQVILLSMLGFNQLSVDFTQPEADGANVLLNEPAANYIATGCGGFRSTDLNSADLRVLGQNPMPVAPTTSGAGSTKG